jgi:hypothetical protein
MSTAEQRRRELEEKKAKLAEMKRARDERMAAANQARQPVSRGPVSDGRRLEEIIYQLMVVFAGLAPDRHLWPHGNKRWTIWSPPY